MSTAGPPGDAIDQAQRLEAVFLPWAREKRQKIHKPGEEPTRFVHYTTAEAAHSIISTKRLMMRNARLMVDYSEIEHGIKLVDKYMSDPAKNADFIEALDKCSPGLGGRAFSAFNAWRADMISHTYITCISEHRDAEDEHGRLSMWRAFGANTNCVALVLRIPFYTGAAGAMNVIFSPVIYPKLDEAMRWFDLTIEKINSNSKFLSSVDPDLLLNWAFFMLTSWATCVKHEGFAEEMEWRAIHSPHRAPSHYIKREDRIIRGIPQSVRMMPIDKSVAAEIAGLDAANIFDHLIIGPSSNPAPLHSFFVDALKAMGIADAEKRVVDSGIPIRT